ncbi:MAG TPA: DUF1579 domain-containing protein [Planctomycetota bacterium]|nr:DUF1579 domain-containing protein [Planctomycetota bacterium]
MKTRTALLSVVAVFGLGSANPVFSQDHGGEKKAEKPVPESPTPEQMKAWMESVSPGEPHKRLEAQTGDYTVKGRTWVDSKASPMEMNGTASIKMIIGGRYQALEFKGDTMGMPFEGTSLTGFDNVAKEYFSTWVDNMRTGIVFYRGKADDKGVVTMSCEIDDPMNPTVKCKCRQVVRSTDKDHFSTETWMKHAKDLEEFKAAEMSFTRRK